MNRALAAIGMSRATLLMLLACIAAYGLGKSSFGFTPVILDSFMNGLGLSSGPAGALMSFELLLVSVITLAIAPKIGGLSKVRLYFVGGLIVLTGQVISTFADTLALMVFARAIVAIGAACTVAAANASVGASENPERLFAHVYVWAAVGQAAIFPVLTVASTYNDHRGVFVVLAVLAAGSLVFARFLPAHSNKEVALSLDGGQRRAIGYWALGAVFLFYLPMGGIWAFVHRIGLDVGTEPQRLGFVFTLAMLAGVASGLVAATLALRYGRILPIAISAILFVVSVLTLTQTQDQMIFAVAFIGNATGFYLGVPYMFGLGAAIDHDGSWSAAIGGVYLLGMSLGPAIAGQLIEAGGYPALGIFAAVTEIVAVLMALKVARSLASQR